MEATEDIPYKEFEACAFFHCQENDSFLLLDERD